MVIVGITFLTVYLTGVRYDRAIATNTYLSLTIIAVVLFLFMVYGLYTGVGLIDNFPSRERYRPGRILSNLGSWSDLPSPDGGDGIGGFLISVVLWIAIALVCIVLLILLEVMFWVSIFVILAMLYCMFFQALKQVFDRSDETKGNVVASMVYALRYTLLYTGWLFGVVYLAEVLG